MDSEIKRDLKSNSVISGQPTYEACDDVKHVMIILTHGYRFVCVEILRPSQPSWVMSSAVSLPNHTFTGQG